MQNRKCGITTITFGTNYGNRLQNYALQKVLKNMNIDSETIQYEPKYLDVVKNDNSIFQKIDKNLKIGLKSIFRKIYKRVNKKQFEIKENKRNDEFEEFKEKYIKFSKNNYKYGDNLNKINNDYDFFITGSDQVWNPGYEGSNEFYYLSFSNQNKTIAYAPSFGVSEIPKEKENFYAKMLKNIKYLSVREERGKEIIKELTGRDAKVVLDPTLLLDKEEWMKISKKFETNSKYVATYFLGILTSSKRKEIEKFARKKHLKIINIYDRNDINSEFCGPSEFLGILANAEYIFTDSFHGTVFSIIFNKPFTVWERYDGFKTASMSSRIESILKMLNLEKCQKIINKEDIDFNNVKEVLKLKRDESLKFLQNSIQEINNK